MAGLIQESPKPEAATQPAAPSRFPHLFGLVGGEGSKTTESKIASKIESISDWQRHATGTPDTSASVHRARLDQAPHTKSPAGPAASSEEMLSETAMNSLVNGYAAEASLLPASLTESQASSATPNNAGKAWNWFKRAGSAIKPPALPSSLLNHETSQTVVEKSQNHVLPEIKLKEAIQPMIRELPRRPSKHDMQTHKHTHSRSKPSLKQATNKITAEIETLLQDQPPTLREAADPMFTAEDPESWGPGALVLDDGISESSVPFDASQGSQNPPWWARPVDALDERSRRKLGLKPLHLKRNDQAKSGVSKNENGPKERERNDRAANRPPPLFTSTGANKAIDSGKVSPGVPLAGQRRTRNSKLSMREAEHEHARPLPADIPESPFSSRRFSKVATVRLGHRAAPSRALVPQDAVPEDADAPPTMQIPAGRQAARKPDSKEAYSHAGLTESSKSVPLSKVVATGGEASSMILSWPLVVALYLADKACAILQGRRLSLLCRSLPVRNSGPCRLVDLQANKAEHLQQLPWLLDVTTPARGPS